MRDWKRRENEEKTVREMKMIRSEKFPLLKIFSDEWKICVGEESN